RRFHMATFSAKNVSVSINRSPAEVYEFISNPENLSKWASGLGGTVKNIDGEWTAEGPLGKIKIKFADKNEYGVLDHDVTLSSGAIFHNPMRVIKNNEGSEIIFTLY